MRFEKIILILPLFLVGCKQGSDSGDASRASSELLVYQCVLENVDQSTSCLPGEPCETIINQIVYACDDGSAEGCIATTEADGSPRYVDCQSFDWSSVDGLYQPE